MPRSRDIAWSKNSLERLGRAVRKYNKVIENWEQRSFDEIPRKTSVQREMRKVTNYEELEKRIYDLESITLPGSDVPVSLRGTIVPEYMTRIVEDLELEIDESRRAQRNELYPEWDKLTPQQRAEARSHANIDPLDKGKMTAQYMEDLEEERLSEKDANYIANYEAEWMKLSTDKHVRDQVVEDLEWIYENSPGTLKFLTQRGDDATAIEYIYEYKTAYARPFEKRREDIEEYWHQVREHLEEGKDIHEFEFKRSKEEI